MIIFRGFFYITLRVTSSSHQEKGFFFLSKIKSFHHVFHTQFFICRIALVI